MSIQFVLDDQPTSSLGVAATVGNRAMNKWSPGGGKPTFRASVTTGQLPQTNLFAAPVQVVAGIPNAVIVVKAFEIVFHGQPALPGTGNQGANASANFLAGTIALPASPATALANINNRVPQLGYGAAAPTTAIVTMAAAFATGGTSDYFFASSPNLPTNGNTAALVGQPVWFGLLVGNYSGGGSASSFFTITVDYEVRPIGQ